jgi:DNA processing protein
MARNQLIYGLGRALVVIEAGETGGTMQAGLRALSVGKPVLALSFEESQPVGNRILIERGAIEVRHTKDLIRIIEAIEDTPLSQKVTTSQLTLL